MRSLHFKRIDETHTEVWRDGEDRRSQSTEAVQLVLQQLMDRQVYERFWSQLAEVGSEAELDDPNNDGIASQLEVR